jgi:hypothetical protein
VKAGLYWEVCGPAFPPTGPHRMFSIMKIYVPFVKYLTIVIWRTETPPPPTTARRFSVRCYDAVLWCVVCCTLRCFCYVLYMSCVLLNIAWCDTLDIRILYCLPIYVLFWFPKGTTHWQRTNVIVRYRYCDNIWISTCYTLYSCLWKNVYVWQCKARYHYKMTFGID